MKGPVWSATEGSLNEGASQDGQEGLREAEAPGRKRRGVASATGRLVRPGIFNLVARGGRADTHLREGTREASRVRKRTESWDR